MKVLFTYDYGEKKMNLIKEMGYELIYAHETEVSNNSDIEDIDVLVCYNPFDRLDVSKLKKLKWIQLSSIGINHAPIDYIKEKGIALTNNKGGYSIPMGEWIILNILEIYKDSKFFYDNQKNKKWKYNSGILELYGKTVGFLGTGTIAAEAAKRLQGFGVNILGLNTSGRDQKYFDECYSITEIDELLIKSDVVVCTIPYTEKTHHLLDGRKLDLMKKESALINVSRGSIIDEEMLINKIKEGNFRGVALDVFENEPLSENNPLWTLPNIYITPHNSWVSEMRNERRFNLIYENLKNYKNNVKLKNIVDLNKGY